MQNKHDQTICDYDKIILNDGVAIVSGYVELKKDGLTMFISDDPNNNNPRPGVIINRLKSEQGDNLITAIPINNYPETEETLHFCNLGCMNEYFERLEKEATE